MMNVKEIIKATGGHLVYGDLNQKINGVSTDSRTVLRRNLFIALKGKKFDGHRFLSSVVQKKVNVLLVSQKPKKSFLGVSVIVVKDTAVALECLAQFHRLKFPIPIIAITGSSGKTTTKELIASVLKKKFNVLKSVATENNFIGVSKTLLNLRSKHDIAILEFGTNHFGEIENLTRIAHPTISILTNIGESHLEFLKTPAGVFKEKKAIYKNLNREGVVIFNEDDLFLRKIRFECIK
ncbi:MAG: UDP-N-acetylmuramoyl-tripeptide--D-alanyl-D-alanine ligase, partial [Candidatus Omnitrophica bacterium]|nr:UDP-N-acetylmuramoyl-tripeptide--D-alanyl-D-alanine ligase [Candidatus Omnitrophota bacterium]